MVFRSYFWSIGYFGLKEPGIFASQKAAPGEDGRLETTTASHSLAKHEKFGLTSAGAQQHLSRLLELWNENVPSSTVI